MNISIVIPNFNGKDLLLKNIPKVIESLASYKKGSVEIIVTDDASKDGSMEALGELLRKRKKDSITFQLLENNSGSNKGFAGNVDKGVSHAHGDIIVLFNTDVVPHKDFLIPLLSHFDDQMVFAVGCMDESIEEGKTILRGRGVGKWEKGFLVHSAANVEKNDTTLWVSCGSGAFRKTIWDKIGGLNELYNPFYWEDIDLSYRAVKCGYKIAFEPKSIVVHEHNKGAIKSNYSPFRVRKIVYRNQFLFTWLNITDKMLLVQQLVWMPYFFIRGLLHRDRAFFVGLFLAILKLPKVFTYREKMTPLFVKTDKEVTITATV